MAFNTDIHKRQSIRLKGYDYSQSGAYFITICAQNRECLFGDAMNGAMVLNEAGNMVQKAWDELPIHYQFIELDQFMIMPNHIHGIVCIVGAGFKPAPDNPNTGWVTNPPLQNQNTPQKRAGLKPAPTSLPEIVRGFKTFSARQINVLRNTPGVPVWQRNYYEHIIRNDDELNLIREYIINNPLRWHLDKENPDGSPDEKEKIFWKCFS